MIEIRPIQLPADADAVETLDANVETDAILAAIPSERGFDLLVMGDRAVKRYRLDDIFDGDQTWDSAWVASDDDVIVGFAATEYQAWNRRLIVRHLYVDAPSRRQGVGWRLVEAVQAEADQRGALNIWLETSNRNLPAIEAYKAMGFQVTGLDLTLYDGTEAEGEFAIFLNRMME